MKEFNMTGLRERLDQLTTDELDAMLNAELERDKPDPASVRLLMDILEGKDTAPVEITPKKEAAWKRYQERVKGLKKKSSRSKGWLLKVASIVLAAGLLFAMVPQEAEAESFWDVLVRWTQNAMEYFHPEENKKGSPFEFKTDNSGLQQVYDAVMEMGIEQPLVPMWLPEGYELNSLTTVNEHNDKYIVAQFISENKATILQVRFLEKGILHGYFGEEEWYQQFEREGTNFKIMRNNNSWIVVWIRDNKIEYSLAIECQEDTLQRILETIYVMEG